MNQLINIRMIFSKNKCKAFGIKKRNRRVLPPELQCMGRKCGGGQCTRSKKPGHDYCLSHLKNLKYGSILDESIEFKSCRKRGRKPIKQNYP